MNPADESPTTNRAAGRMLPLIAALFAGSGCAALIYEVVWLQLLQLTIGSSAVSLSVLLGTFMGGMCLGSLLLPRLVGAGRHPLAVYAMLEFGIAASGLLVLVGGPALGGAYDRLGLTGYAGILGRGLVASACLLPPTMMMGATLPAVARWVRMTPGGMAWLGWFYAGNIAGAVAGCLLASFALLRHFDMATATYVAMACNVVVGAIGLAVAGGAGWLPEPARAAGPRRGPWSPLVAVALSGLTALAAEVVWTRLLALQFGGTVYAFSLILAVFLAGLGIGSVAGAAVGRRSSRPGAALAACQMLLVAAMAWAAWQLSRSLPHWPINPSIATDPVFVLQLDLVRCLWVVLPAACLWGASFALAVAAARGPGGDPARLVGGVAAANTAGGIVGALAAPLAVWWLGSQRTQQVLVAISAASACALVLFPPEAGTTDSRGRRQGWSTALAAVALAAAAAWTVPPISGPLVAYGRHSGLAGGRQDIFYVGEGLQTAVAVSRTETGRINYHNAGKVQASSEPQDMRLQRMLGHLATLVPPNPRRVLVIGFGAGVTAGAVSADPRVVEETIVEIEPLVPRAVADHFSRHNNGVAADPRVRIRIDDGRHFLLTTRETFDAITSDPLDPWVKGAAALYTRECFELVRSRLNAGGVFTLFVQLYETSEEAVRTEVATFLDVFPEGMVFGNTQDGRGYDLVLLGRAGGAAIDVDAVTSLLGRPDMAGVARSLDEAGLGSATDLLATFAAGAADLKPWLDGARINRDADLRLQYVAGAGLNEHASERIYAGMLRGPFRFPAEGFRGSEGALRALEEAMRRRRP
ncbi:MAG: SAM-dependent methyltransferase [Planctomycetia bacterium]|nr:SAM-dependent methyltransferase [Planctomycetia bacterium]